MVNTTTTTTTIALLRWKYKEATNTGLTAKEFMKDARQLQVMWGMTITKTLGSE